MNKERLNSVRKAFIDKFGNSSNEIRFFAAPGRVNLIGEHIDYCGGFVLPAALTLDTLVAVRINDSRSVNMAATDLKDIVSSFSLDDIDSARSLKWGNYQAGVAKELENSGYKLVGCDMLFDGTIPYGSGLSSSASIELASAIAFATLANEYSENIIPIDLIQLAIAGQKSENNFCNVSCGIMDQFASAMGRKDNAIMLNCGSLSYEYCPLILEGYSIIIGNTNKKRSLAESKYNERRAEVDEGFETLLPHLTNKPNLCSISPEEFEANKHYIENETIRRRVEHVVYENYRVIKSLELLKSNDINGFGKLLYDAHASIRDLYEVTGVHLDTMVEEAMKIEGTVGARMTGAGFGGCTVNIVKKESIDNFIACVGKNYTSKTGLIPEFYVCEIGDGAREIKI